MILLIKKEQTYKEGDTFPLLTLPLKGKGEDFTFYDFQWWGPTKEWKSWLQKNPREWQAESEVYDFSDEEMLEFMAEGETSSLMGFDEFKSLFEETGEELDTDSGGALPASEDRKKKFTKLVFAFNKLSESGRINTTLNTSSLQKGGEYAIIGDLQLPDGTPDESTRQAYKIKVTNDSEKAVIALCNESIPQGILPESEDGGGSEAIREIAEVGAQLLASGIIGIIGIAVAWNTAKFFIRRAATLNLLRSLGRITPPKPPKSRIFRKGRFIRGAFRSGWLKGKQAFKGARAAGKGFRAASQAFGKAYVKAFGKGISRPLTRTLGKIAGKGVAKTVSRFIPFVGWGMLVFDIIQTTANWSSTNQAPTLSKVEDWATGYFAPGSIPDGEEITICWTHEPDTWGSFFSGMVWDSSTRTTMDLIKLGNFDGRAVFLLVDINSKEFKKVLQEKDLILLSFDQSARFDRAWYDNDNLNFEMVTYDQGEQEYSYDLTFYGYCGWEEIESAYMGSDEEFLAVPENAPDEYTFHFKYGKSDRDVNVKGVLIKNINSIEGAESVFESRDYEETEEEYRKLVTSLAESSGVLSFENFSRLTEEENLEAGEETPEKETYLTGTVKIAAYDVQSIEYADSSLKDLELPGLQSFIIPDNFLEAKDQETILVEPVQEVYVRYPRRGSVKVETEVVPDPVLPDTTPGDADGPTGGVPVIVKREEIVKTYKDRPEVLNNLGIRDVSKIKDKSLKDEIKILDMITPEEKEKLGIDEWDEIKNVKIVKDGKTMEPILIKFRGGGNRAKFRTSDENFDTALRVAERVQAGFETEEDQDQENRQPTLQNR